MGQDTFCRSVHLILNSYIGFLPGFRFEMLSNTVAEGQKVAILGFGNFEPRQRSAREGRNPQTGEKLTIPASTLPGFSPGKSFKAAVAKV